MSSLRDRLLSSNFIEGGERQENSPSGVVLDIEDDSGTDYSGWVVEGHQEGGNDASLAAAALTTGTAASLAASIAAMGAAAPATGTAAAPTVVAAPPVAGSAAPPAATGTAVGPVAVPAAVPVVPVVPVAPAATVVGPTGAPAVAVGSDAPAVAVGSDAPAVGPTGATGTDHTTMGATGVTGTIDPDVQTELTQLKAEKTELETAIRDLAASIETATTTDQKAPLEVHLRITSATLEGVKAKIDALEKSPADALTGVKKPEGPLGVILGDEASMEMIQTKVDERIEELSEELDEKKKAQEELLANENATELQKAVIKDDITVLEDKISALKEGAFIDVLGDRYHLGKVQIMSGKIVVLPTDVSGTVRISDVSEAALDLVDPAGVMSFQQFLINYGIHALNKVSTADVSEGEQELTDTILQFRRFFNVDVKKRVIAECTPKMFHYVYPYLIYRRGTLARHTLMYTDDDGNLYPGGQHFAGLYTAFNDLIKNIEKTCGTAVDKDLPGNAVSKLLAAAGKMSGEHGDIMKKLAEIMAEIKKLKGCASFKECLDDPEVKAKIQTMLSAELTKLKPAALDVAAAKGTAPGTPLPRTPLPRTPLPRTPLPRTPLPRTPLPGPRHMLTEDQQKSLENAGKRYVDAQYVFKAAKRAFNDGRGNIADLEAKGRDYINAANSYADITRRHDLSPYGKNLANTIIIRTQTEVANAIGGPPPLPPPATTPDAQLKDVLKFLDLSIQADDPPPAGLFSMTAANADKDFYNANNAMGAILNRNEYTNPNTGATQRVALMSVILAAIGRDDFNGPDFGTINNILNDSTDGSNEQLHILANAIRSAQHALGYLNVKPSAEAKIKRLPLSLSRVMNAIAELIGSRRRLGEGEPFLFEIPTNGLNTINNLKNSLGLGSKSTISKGQFYSFIHPNGPSTTISINGASNSSNTDATPSNINTFMAAIRSDSPSLYVITKRQLELYMLAAMRLYIYYQVDDNEVQALYDMIPLEPSQLEHIAAVAGLTSAISAASALTAAAAATVAAATAVRQQTE